MAQITITNVEKIVSGQYKVYFNYDSEIVDLFFQISANSIIWNTPTAIGIVSPQTISVTNLQDFYIRLSTDYEIIIPVPTYTRVHTNVFTNTFN
jgi:hypothetical protein